MTNCLLLFAMEGYVIKTEENIYGLSEGVFKACLYLGLKFPSVAVDNPQPVPSDYFGDDFELDSTTIKKLRLDLKWTRNKFSKQYKAFTKKFSTQKPLRQTKTDLSVYFCDFALCHKEQILASYGDYFDFEFYNKSLKLRGTFLLSNYSRRRALFNDLNYMTFVNNKVKTNQFFDEFLRRDWIYTRTCTFEEFKIFVEKHPCFFSKIFNGASGRGAQVVKIDPNEDIEKVFADFKGSDRIMEEIVTQHETLAAFCPDTVNTIRVNTILDVHNVVHILTTSGRFGRVGSVVDNFHGGGVAVVINPETGVVTSDAINSVNERFQKHPDTGKIFKGFQYPCWEKVRSTVTKMAKMIPQIRHIGWDIVINDKEEIVLVEANLNPDADLTQAPDDKGRLYLYQPLLEEMQAYKKEEMKLLGYRVNNIQDFDSAYELSPALWNPKRKFAIDKLIPECTSLIDVGCRKSNFVKTTTPPHVSKYYPVDYKNYDDDEIIVCNFNEGEFPDIKADACLCALTAEFVELLPQFLANMCNAAHKQILIWCRPADKETQNYWRWSHPFLTDFTEEFLIKTMEQKNFKLNAQYPDAKVPSIILYDFRKI